MALSKSQIKQLRTLAHSLKTIVTIGQNGVTENVINELEIALDFHELVKVKLASGDRDDRKEMLQILHDRTAAEIIQTIGKTATLFRRNSEKPKITFQ